MPDVEDEVMRMMAHAGEVDGAYQWQAVQGALQTVSEADKAAFLAALHRELRALDLDPAWDNI